MDKLFTYRKDDRHNWWSLFCDSSLFGYRGSESNAQAECDRLNALAEKQFTLRPMSELPESGDVLVLMNLSSGRQWWATFAARARESASAIGWMPLPATDMEVAK